MVNTLQEFKKNYEWLDNNKYDNSLKNLSLHGWCDLIYNRIEAIDSIKNNEKTIALQFFAEAIKNNSILDITENVRDPSLYYPAPVEVLDYMDLHSQAFQNPIPLFNIKKSKKEYLNYQHSEDYPLVVKKYYDSNLSHPDMWSVIGEKKRYHYEDFCMAFLKIDLSATDTTIMDAMRIELSKIREKSKYKPFRKNITDNDIARYIRLRIVQYIDIKIFSYYYDLPIPNNKQLAMLIYPDELYNDVDVIDRVRRTTKTVADEVFSNDFLFSLCLQAEVIKDNKINSA